GAHGLQQVIQIPVANGDAVIAAAMLASYRCQLLAVEPRQQDTPLAVAHETAFGQWYRCAGAGADTEDGQLGAELPGVTIQNLALLAVQPAGHQEDAGGALGLTIEHLPRQGHGLIEVLA